MTQHRVFFSGYVTVHADDAHDAANMVRLYLQHGSNPVLPDGWDSFDVCVPRPDTEDAGQHVANALCALDLRLALDDGAFKVDTAHQALLEGVSARLRLALADLRPRRQKPGFGTVGVG